MRTCRDDQPGRWRSPNTFLLTPFRNSKLEVVQATTRHFFRPSTTRTAASTCSRMLLFATASRHGTSGLGAPLGLALLAWLDPDLVRLLVSASLLVIAYVMLTPSLAAAARARGRSTVWVEPVGSGPPPARGALVVWRERPGRPSPNQLNALHQAAAILALVWDRHDSLV